MGLNVGPFEASYLRPRLNPAGELPSLLVRWWALLLALSSVARYEPEAWTAALDVDSSPLAVDLETGLAIAEGRVPQLVHEALSVDAGFASGES